MKKISPQEDFGANVLKRNIKLKLKLKLRMRTTVTITTIN